VIISLESRGEHNKKGCFKLSQTNSSGKYY
jgi:hypothetical protein